MLLLLLLLLLLCLFCAVLATAQCTQTPMSLCQTPLTAGCYISRACRSALMYAAAQGHVAAVTVSPKRLLDDSPWLQSTSECQRFWPPPRLNK